MTRDAILRGVAAIFALVTIQYGVAYMYYARIQTASAELGFSSAYSEQARAAVVGSVDTGGPAAQAGLASGDRIMAANGVRLSTVERFNRWDRSPAQDVVVFTVVHRPGHTPATSLVTVRLADTAPISLKGVVENSVVEMLGFYPVVFLTVGLTVLMLRPSNPFAWVMATLFACFLSLPSFPRAPSGLPTNVAAFVLGYKALALPAIPMLFYGFFARFPARSPLDVKLPWLKWLNVVGWVLFSVPNLGSGGPTSSPAFMVRALGQHVADIVRVGYLLSVIPLGIAALVWNVKGAPTADTRRKARVLLWGAVAGIGPILIFAFVQLVLHQPVPTWLNNAANVMLFSFPLSFAYAVVKHRVLDIPVLLHRSARYVLVRRGFFVLLAMLGITATAAFTYSFTRLFDVQVPIATAAGVVFGMALVTGSAPLVKRATTRIDRAFFRTAYNATAILENLAATIPQVTSRDTLAALLEREITQALHPVGVIVYLEDPDERLLHPRASRWHRPTPPLPTNVPWLIELARRAKPWDVSSGSKEEPPPMLRESEAECLVPITGRGGRLHGVVIVGASPSEQPYSRDDKRLLLAVANQAGGALENIMLAERMAERLGVERAAAREIEIARQVQFRLFPQKQPPLRTIDYAGGCVQARHVGGDYYDFVDLGAGLVGFVVADISGKGIAAALLMANLQANLRGQYATAGDLSRLLKSVNKLFYDNTNDNQYATLFFGEYSDETRRLHFANCGHFPPLLLRADGTVEQLHSTAMVLGLFEDWTVTTCDRELKVGDVLVIYTDGVIEAMNHAEEEFGTERLIETVRLHRERPAADLVTAIHATVQAFVNGAPSDDLTVVVAKVR